MEQQPNNSDIVRALTDIALAIVGEGKKRITGWLKLHTTSSKADLRIETGYVTFQPGTGSSGGQPVTFSEAFSSPPMVVASFAGDSGSTTTAYGLGLVYKQQYGGAHTVTANGFTAYCATRDSTNYAAGSSTTIAWIAIGV